jgi:hypothetical protein
MRKFSFKYDEYSVDTGVLDEPDEAMVVECTINDEKTCTSSANREGLIALAKSLIKLADTDVPAGCHFHLDYPVWMEEGSAELIVLRT